MPKLSTRKVNIEPMEGGVYEQSNSMPGPSPQPANLPFNRGFINPFFSYDFEVNAINPRGPRFFRTWNIVNSQSQNLTLLLHTSGTTKLT